MKCFKKAVKKMKSGKAMDKVIMHCAATPDADESDPRWFNLDIEEVRRWHVEGRGWRDVGYHFFIKRDGTTQKGRTVGTAGAHTLGENHNIGVCYAGTRVPTKAQEQSLRALAEVIREKHGIGPLDWHCHSEFANKECPGFDQSDLHWLLTKSI